MRFTLFTGKGGVGKTTIAAATALHISNSGLKTLDFHLKLDKFGDELIFNLDNKRRNFFLHKFAHFHSIASFTYTAPWLNIQLVKC